MIEFGGLISNCCISNYQAHFPESDQKKCTSFDYVSTDLFFYTDKIDELYVLIGGTNTFSRVLPNWIHVQKVYADGIIFTRKTVI